MVKNHTANFQPVIHWLNNKEEKMYYILVKYYYHRGTYGARKNGPMSHPVYEDKYEFETLEEAKEHLKENGITWKVSNQTYQYEGNYTLFHGEYQRPSYQIRKVRRKNV